MSITRVIRSSKTAKETRRAIREKRAVKEIRINTNFTEWDKRAFIASTWRCTPIIVAPFLGLFPTQYKFLKDNLSGIPNPFHNEFYLPPGRFIFLEPTLTQTDKILLSSNRFTYLLSMIAFNIVGAPIIPKSISKLPHPQNFAELKTCIKHSREIEPNKGWEILWNKEFEDKITHAIIDKPYEVEIKNLDLSFKQNQQIVQELIAIKSLW